MSQPQSHVRMSSWIFVARVKTSKQSVAMIFRDADHPQSLLPSHATAHSAQERCQVQSQHLMGSSSEKYAAPVKRRPQVMISLAHRHSEWPRLSHHGTFSLFLRFWDCCRKWWGQFLAACCESWLETICVVSTPWVIKSGELWLLNGNKAKYNRYKKIPLPARKD